MSKRSWRSNKDTQNLHNLLPHFQEKRFKSDSGIGYFFFESLY